MTYPLVMLTLAQAGADTPPSKTLLEYIREGGSIGYVIILLSFVAVALVIVHFIRIRTSRLTPPAIVHTLDRMLRENHTETALAYCNEPDNECFLTRVFGAALARCARSPFGFLELRTALEEAGQEEVARLHRSSEGVALIAAVAPMLGLLGTVVGMVLAFDTISTSKGLARPDQLAGYISLALVTTVEGLIVAIPCTAVFAYMRSRIDHKAGEAARIIEELSTHLQSIASGSAQPAPAPDRRSVPRATAAGSAAP